MTHASLFSGIGGFDLAAEWMGWENVFHCEINPFCQRILKYYWPNAKSHTDIKDFDATIYRGYIDIVSGGFPCQPFSVAGKRKGTEDNRYLWPEMLRVIGEIQPKWVVGENVYGLVNWDGGLVFEQVCSDLEAKGYEVQPVVLPACGKDALHRRERIWFVAYRNSNGLNGCNSQHEKYTSNGGKYAQCNAIEIPESNDANTLSDRLEGKLHKSSRYEERGTFETPPSLLLCKDKKQLPKPYTVSSDDGISFQLDGIAFSKWRTESIKGFGNAIVPQVAYEIFQVIEQIEKQQAA